MLYMRSICMEDDDDDDMECWRERHVCVLGPRTIGTMTETAVFMIRLTEEERGYQYRLFLTGRERT